MTTEEYTERELRLQEWSLERVADAVGGGLKGASEGRLAGVSTDTRTIEEGELFVALEGPRFDGHEFVDDAAESGALGAVVRPGFSGGGLPDDFVLVSVEDPREALADLGHAVWSEAREIGLHTVDVTGSNGKTTTKELLSAMWSTQGEAFATPGNLNNAIGLPLTLCSLPKDCEHLVLEMGANAPGEISDLIELAPGSERLVTSIGADHLEGFGSVDGTRRAKSEIFEHADSETLAVVPHAERDRLRLDAFPGRIWTFGSEPDADLRLESYGARAPGRDRRSVSLVHRRGEISVELGLPGRHNALNLACALSSAVARDVEIELEALQEALDGVELPGGRWRRRRVGGFSFVDDAYNANPTNVRASFRAFLESEPDPEAPEGVPRVAVVGEMRELGDESEGRHRAVARDLAEAPELAALCAVGSFAPEMASAARDVADESLEVVACDDVREVARWLSNRGPSFVWMKGSRASELERVVDLVSAFLDDG